MVFSENLKRIRKEKGFTQRTLARALNISFGAVGMYETSQREPDFEMLSKMAKLLQTTTDILLGHEPPLPEYQAYKKSKDGSTYELIEQLTPDEKKIIDDLVRKLVDKK
jgi:transcriptional regulator with XRE-family HTH domain